MIKAKNMLVKKAPHLAKSWIFVGLILALVVALPSSNIVFANTSDTVKEIESIKEKIKSIEKDNDGHEHQQSILGVQATSLEEAINKLQAQIEKSQSRIADLQKQIKDLERQIEETQKELERQKDLLGESIKQMYVSGEISTIEMLATSKDLSDFFDRQQYQEDVQKKIKQTLDRITELKLELNSKKDKVKNTLSEQEALKAQIESQQAEKNRVLALNQAERNELEQKIQENNDVIAKLRQKQIEAEAALARALSSGSYKVSPAGPIGAGVVVGSIGNTGLSSGPHLHLEVRKNGSVVDPGPYIKSSPVNIPPAWVSQGYGVSNPIYYSGWHPGIDYASGAGGPIFAIDSGQMYRGCSNEMLGTSNNAYGYVAIIEHTNGTISIYAHMSGGPSACDYNTYY